MSILSIKSEMLLPEREIILNKKLNIGNKPALIASITEQSGIVKSWIFQQMPDSPYMDSVEEVERIESVTNRDEIWKRASRARVSFGNISEIVIQGVKLPISQAPCGVVEYDPMKYMKLQHFIEAGVDFSSIEDIGFDDLVLGEYQMEEGTVFPKINTEADMPVSLSVRGESCESLVEPSHWFKLKTGELDISRSFNDPSDGNEIAYHIVRITRHDIWKETAERMRDEETITAWKKQGLDEASIERAITTWPQSIEIICPKGHELLILQYECLSDYQLNFYTTDYLLDRPKNDGSSTSVAFIGLGLSGEKSRYGYPIRSCLLKTVPTGFSGEVEVELMSWFKRIPDKKIDA